MRISIYGFEISHEMISNITDCVPEELEQWQNQPLKKYAVYVILGYNINGKKEILGLWLNETESKHHWMQIFDELKKRGWVHTVVREVGR